MSVPILATSASPTPQRESRRPRRPLTRADTNAGLDTVADVRPASRQIRASVLARSQLTVRPMQKSYPNPAALLESRKSGREIGRQAPERRFRFKPGGVKSRSPTAGPAPATERKRILRRTWPVSTPSGWCGPRRRPI